MIPVAAWNITAQGRVDINGIIDSATILSLEPIKDLTNRKDGNVLINREGGVLKTRSFYKGIDEAGWYWIENDRHAKGHKLTIENFFKLLSEVSDYERA